MFCSINTHQNILSHYSYYNVCYKRYQECMNSYTPDVIHNAELVHVMT